MIPIETLRRTTYRPICTILWGVVRAFANSAGPGAAVEDDAIRDVMSVISADANFANVNGWWWRRRDEIKRAHVAAHQTTFQFSRAEVVKRSGSSSPMSPSHRRHGRSSVTFETRIT